MKHKLEGFPEAFKITILKDLSVVYVQILHGTIGTSQIFGRSQDLAR